MARIFANLVSGELGSTLSAGATTMSSPELADLPVITGGDFAYLTIEPEDATNAEIVMVTAHSNGAPTATIVRGQGGTSAVAHSASDPWAATITAEDLDSFLTTASASNLEDQGDVDYDGGTPYPGSELMRLNGSPDHWGLGGLVAARSGASQSITDDWAGLFNRVTTNAATLTVGSSVTAQKIIIYCAGTSLTLVAGGGVTITGPTLAVSQYAAVALIKISSNNYQLVGGLGTGGGGDLSTTDINTLLKLNAIVADAELVDEQHLSTRYYVSDASGNDSNGGTEALPFQTLSAAHTAAREGDIILLERDGSYAPTTISKNGITLGAYGAGAMPIVTNQMTITGDDLRIQNLWFKDYVQRGVFNSGSDGSIIRGCHFSGGTDSVVVHAYGGQGDRMLIEDCKFWDIALHKDTDRNHQYFSAVQFYFSEDCIFRRNDVAPGTIPGLAFREAHNLEVRDNDFHNCHNAIFGFGSNNVQIVKNDIHDGKGSGITTGSMSLLSPEQHIGDYNASTNSPNLTAPTVTVGDWYRVSVAGTFLGTYLEVDTVIQAEVTTPTAIGDWYVLPPMDDCYIAGNRIWNLLRGLGTWNGLDIFVASNRIKMEGNQVWSVNKHCLAIDHYGPKAYDVQTDDAEWYGNHFDARTNTPQDETLVKFNVNGTGYQGLWDASTGIFPNYTTLGAGGVVINNNYTCSVPGQVGGVDFRYGDQINALVNSPSTTVYAGNWEKITDGDALPFAFTMAPSATNPAVIQFKCDMNTYIPCPEFMTGDIICKHGRYTDGFTYYTLDTWISHCATAHNSHDARSVLGVTSQSGWGTGPTNVTPDRFYNANSSTLDECLDVLGTLIQDLLKAGVISP